MDTVKSGYAKGRTSDTSEPNTQGQCLAANRYMGEYCISIRRHGGKSKVAFADGRVESVVAATIYDELNKDLAKGVKFWAGGL